MNSLRCCSWPYSPVVAILPAFKLSSHVRQLYLCCVFYYFDVCCGTYEDTYVECLFSLPTVQIDSFLLHSLNYMQGEILIYVQGKLPGKSLHIFEIPHVINSSILRSSASSKAIFWKVDTHNTVD